MQSEFGQSLFKIVDVRLGLPNLGVTSLDHFSVGCVFFEGLKAQNEVSLTLDLAADIRQDFFAFGHDGIEYVDINIERTINRNSVIEYEKIVSEMNNRLIMKVILN